MKVAFYTYPSAFQNVGGGEILLLKVREYLQKAGVTVDLFDIWNGQIEHYDLLHVFGSVKDCLGLVRVANARGVKVAITPLWWSDWRRAFHIEGKTRTKAEFVLRHAAKLLFPAFPSSRRDLLLASDLVFPNSETERDLIARQFALPRSKMRVVHNGVDKEFADARPEEFRKKYGEGRFLLGVGRIEPRKNQLNLIRAAKLLGRRLFLIGSPVSGSEDYYQRCQKEGAGFTTFLPTMPHGEGLFRSAYAACEGFALQGWFETPGLVALEAGLAGCPVAVTSGGSTRDYFQDLVPYFDPADPKDMAAKIEAAIASPKKALLKKHILDHFTWDKIAADYARHYGR